jgi:2-keto-4-pentenoate hydratase/2-oxohepta-3-ene-1,7-dioic acid hydratase in catechol pathway
MKLVRYERNGALRLGALDGEHVVDLLDACPVGTPPALLAALSDMVMLVAAGNAGLDAVRSALDNARRTGVGRNAADKVKLVAPIMPTLLLCSGENYWDHRDEKPEVTRKDPEFFTKTSLGVIGPGDSIIRDERVTKKLDYETELAIVIGRPGRHIPAQRALEHVFGYTIVNDVTARDRQVTLRPDGSSIYNLGPGKNFDSCAPMGPAIVSAEDIPDPQNLQLKTWINEELRQNNSTAKMIWTCAQLIAFFSTFITLKPGVVIATGTPGGTAWGTDPELGGKKPMRRDTVAPQGYMQPGDVVTCEIQGIGRLANRVVAADPGK